MNEMGLVVVAALQRDLRPVHWMPAMCPRKCLLKTPNPAVALGRDADLGLETFDKSLRAHPDGMGHRSNVRSERGPVEGRQGERDRGMYASWLQHFTESVLDHIELGIAAVALEELFP